MLGKIMGKKKWAGKGAHFWDCLKFGYVLAKRPGFGKGRTRERAINKGFFGSLWRKERFSKVQVPG